MDGDSHLSPVDLHKGLVKRSIDQLGVIKDVNSLVVLSGHLIPHFNWFFVTDMLIHRDERQPLSFALPFSSYHSTKGQGGFLVCNTFLRWKYRTSHSLDFWNTNETISTHSNNNHTSTHRMSSESRGLFMERWRTTRRQGVSTFLLESFFLPDSNFSRKLFCLTRHAASFFWITTTRASPIHLQNLPCSHSRQW